MEKYDFIIIGAGVAGLAGAIYSARVGMKTVCLGENLGGAITQADKVENYPGFESISGAELAEKIRKHAESYENAEIRKEEVEEVSKNEKGFVVKSDKEVYNAKSILFATGTKWRKLEIPGAKELEGKGISYCALCDAPLFKNKIVAVIGGSDSAAKEALVLAEHAKKVYIIYRGEKIHPESANMEKIKKNKKIEIINKTNLAEVKGKNIVESVVLDKEYLGKKELKLDGVFVSIGHIVLSELADKLGVKINEKDEIITDKLGKTNIDGVYAAGDVTDTKIKQVVTGVALACIAANSAFEFVTKK